MIRSQFHFVENTTSDYESKLKAQKENSSRRATAEATFEARGVGSRQIKKPLTFAVTFAEEPHFTSGCATVVNADDSKYFDPIGHCGIYQWQVNDKGQYTGAYLWVSIQTVPKIIPVSTLDDEDTYTRAEARLALAKLTYAAALSTKTLAKMRTMLYLTFTGRAVKDIGQPGATSTVTPRNIPGFNFVTDD